jgi:hypothetical protein
VHVQSCLFESPLDRDALDDVESLHLWKHQLHPSPSSPIQCCKVFSALIHIGTVKCSLHGVTDNPVLCQARKPTEQIEDLASKEIRVQAGGLGMVMALGLIVVSCPCL